MLDEPHAAEQLAVWFRRRYEHTAPATRVRQLAILRSACAFWRKQAWIAADPIAGLERPKVPLDRTRAMTRQQIAALWQRDDIALRERVFWRLLYDTAARANEILSLDIEDLDLPNKRARVRSKGGATEWVFWQTGTALLLPRFAGGAGERPGVPCRSPADTGGARRRSMPTHWTGQVVLPTRGGVVQRGES